MKVKVGNEKWEGTLGAALISHLWQQMVKRWWWQLMWTRLSLMGRSNSAGDLFDLWYICDKCQNINDGTETQTISCDPKTFVAFCHFSSSQTIMCENMKYKCLHFELDRQDYFEYLRSCQSDKIGVAFKVHTHILISGIL